MKTKTIFLSFSLAVIGGWLFWGSFMSFSSKAAENTKQRSHHIMNKKDLKTATFAGGCFWCMESDFEKMPGIEEVISGYTGGKKENPTYQEVSSHQTDHVEAVQIFYDPSKTSYEKILDFFWRHIDPTDEGGQFVDRGPQYQSAIFYQNEKEEKAANQSKDHLEKSGVFQRHIVTKILPLQKFYNAEEYHQDYYKKEPIHYHLYREHSGRDQFIQKTWKDSKHSSLEPSNQPYSIPSDQELQKNLSPLQYKVTRQEGTEPPFHNEYWDNEKAGIYVDIISGEALFSSLDKFHSGTGWPSFTRPLEKENILEKKDGHLFMTRTEVRSKHANSHLGHVFPDGPAPTHLRYCVNSASLRFIPAESLKEKGYEQFASLFKNH